MQVQLLARPAAGEAGEQGAPSLDSRTPSACLASLPSPREVEPGHRVCPVLGLRQVDAQVLGRSTARRLAGAALPP